VNLAVTLVFEAIVAPPPIRFTAPGWLDLSRVEPDIRSGA